MLTDMSTENSGDSRNYTETVGTRLTPQTKRQFEDYREQNELGKTEAARRLIRDGLDDTDETLDTVQKLSLFGGIAYIAVYLAGGVGAAGALGGVFIIMLMLWSSFPSIRAILSQIGG